MSLDQIKAAIPHREPFLLIDEVVEQSDSRIVCRKKFTGEEFWYRGHYPDFPITPGVILCEAAMQAGAVLLSKLVTDAGDPQLYPPPEMRAKLFTSENWMGGTGVLVDEIWLDIRSG